MNNDYNNNGFGGFDQENGTYHYNYMMPPQQSANPEPPQPEKPRKKRGAAGKVVALVLCCALVGGGAGVGGAAAFGALNNNSSGSQAGTTIYQNKTDPTPVEVKQANGLTPMSLAEINAAYADSCVCITVKAVREEGYYQYETSGAGSGFIISQDGYIVTNYHVIKGATAVKVTLNNGEQYDAKVVGGEELNDVAVLKIDGVTGLKPVVLGDSDDLVVGETVSTIGNALGTLSFSQTSGGVSATNRSVTMSDGTVLNMIQTDCTINSGNSGGPLFDSYGRVVGITSAKFSNNGDTSQASIEGIGFAIPINDVIDIITDYMKFGYVTGRPAMGITVAEITEQYQQVFGWPAGVYVNSVEEGSSAQAAGMKQGDIITKINDTEITGVSQLTSVKNSYKAGDTVKITVFRAGEELTLTLTFDEQTNQTTNPQQPTSPAQPDGNENGGYGGGYEGEWPWSDWDDSAPQETGSGNGYVDPWEWFFGGGR